ncbi:MAG: hypothetical protein HYZ26_09425 [Chloroflexi bacterium]|nr:hypothetical protein [Chloroflexota bacterium]
MDEKITIIEGPPPTFDVVHELWANGIHEAPTLSKVVVTQLRTFNGAELVERCHRAWRHREPIQLEFKSPDGLKMEAPIVAARTTQTDNGDLLHLWVRLPEDEIEVEFGYVGDEDGDDGEYDDDEFDLPDTR